MITLHQKQYARNNNEMLDTLFTGPETAAGFYRVNRGKNRTSVLIMDAQREPVALVSPDGVLVTAFRTPNGIRFMYALTQSTRAQLGMPQETTMREECEAGASVLAQVGAAPVHA